MFVCGYYKGKEQSQRIDNIEVDNMILKCCSLMIKLNILNKLEYQC